MIVVAAGVARDLPGRPRLWHGQRALGGQRERHDDQTTDLRQNPARIHPLFETTSDVVELAAEAARPPVADEGVVGAGARRSEAYGIESEGEADPTHRVLERSVGLRARVRHGATARDRRSPESPRITSPNPRRHRHPRT